MSNLALYLEAVVGGEGIGDVGVGVGDPELLEGPPVFPREALPPRREHRVRHEPRHLRGWVRVCECVRVCVREREREREKERRERERERDSERKRGEDRDA